MAGGYLQVSIIYENRKTHLSEKIDDDTVMDYIKLRETLETLAAELVNAFASQQEDE